MLANLTTHGSVLTLSQLTAIQAANVVFRDDPCKKYRPMGARGSFFTLGTSNQRLRQSLTSQRVPFPSRAEPSSLRDFTSEDKACSSLTSQVFPPDCQRHASGPGEFP